MGRAGRDRPRQPARRCPGRGGRGRLHPHGKRFSLALPLCRPGGDPVLPGRPPARHAHGPRRELLRRRPLGAAARRPKFAEDSISLPCHGTTHMDALGHAWCGDQLWNGHPAQTTAGGLTRASIGALAARGIVAGPCWWTCPGTKGPRTWRWVGRSPSAISRRRWRRSGPRCAGRHPAAAHGHLPGVLRTGPGGVYADFDELA